MEFARTTQVIEEGLHQGHHIAAQVYIWREEQLWSTAFGEGCSPESLFLWMSSGKPLTAMAIARLRDEGKLKLDDSVSDIIPEFARDGKEKITLRQLLTHTAPIRRADKIAPNLAWAEIIARICATPVEADWAPGEKAGYSTAAGWFLLGEIIQRVSGRTFREYMSMEIFEPLGMHDSGFGLDPEQVPELSNRLQWMHNTASGQPQKLPLENPEHVQLVRPGSSARGPIHELARFYRCLMADGTIDSQQIFAPATVQEFTRRQRTGMFDQTFMHKIDFGLGFVVNSYRYGAEVPYNYGPFASPETFGHSGMESSCAFADPAHNLVVAWVFNGLCGSRAHHQRARAMNTAIYEDLELSSS